MKTNSNSNNAGNNTIQKRGWFTCKMLRKSWKMKNNGRQTLWVFFRSQATPTFFSGVGIPCSCHWWWPNWYRITLASLHSSRLRFLMAAVKKIILSWTKPGKLPMFLHWDIFIFLVWFYGSSWKYFLVNIFAW